MQKMYDRCMEDGQTGSTVEFHKVTVNLIPKAWDAANETAERLGLSRTDVINRALQAYAFLERATADGSEVLVRSRDGHLEQVKFL
jgi:hypothetical protein